MIGVNFSPKQPRGLKAIDPSRLDFSREEMTMLTGEAIRLLNDQVHKGLNSKGYPAKPLSQKYKAKKLASGKPGIRDLEYSGAMLRSLAPVDVQMNHAAIGFTRDAENIKAIANETRSNWFGLTKLNEEKVWSMADKILVTKTK